MACPLQGLLAAQGALITTVPEDPAAVSRWVSKCHQQRWARAVTPPRPKGSIVTHCVSQDGRVEAYTAGGSAYQSVVSPLRGWGRSSTTLPPGAIKMFLRNHHRVVLQRLNRSYLPPLKVPHLQQAMQAKDLYFLKIYVNDVTHWKYWVSFAKKKSLSCPSKCLQLVQVLKSHENHGIYWWNVFTTVGSTKQGLTKAETIQVKGDECLHTPHITVMDYYVAESG